MSNTKEGGKKVAVTNKKIHGDDYYQRIGALGGSKKTVNTKNKGFGTNRELAKSAGAVGGRISRRTKK